DARRAALWLHQLELVETPPGLEARILALTIAPPPQESFWAVFDRGWRALMQPRFALGLAAAAFSLLLVMNTFGLSLRGVTLSDLNPANLYRAAERQTQLSYARTMRFVNDLRLVYEIRSRLEELAPQSEPPQAPAPAPTQNPATPKTNKEKKPQNSSDGARAQWLLALQTPPFGIGGLGGTR
ncbi:MAG: hypothetical protein ACRD4D_06910, partial [Candidatus Acidiferrales bacterium]